MLPVLYVPHGAGPLPLLDHPTQEKLTTFLKNIPKKLGLPKAIVMISAHFEASQPTITGAKAPELIYDYSGFPTESYSITYPAQGNTTLASDIQKLLHVKEIASQISPSRGYDHGMFVPLKLMYPTANIPVVQLSLDSSLDPALHVKMGEALRPLREQGILIVGSGLSFHNMRGFFTPTSSLPHGLEFDAWLQQTLTTKEYDTAKERLISWVSAPQARFSHPREEHLLPLHVCFGAAGDKAEVVFDDVFMNAKVSGFLWN